MTSSVKPTETFLIFMYLSNTAQAGEPLPRKMLDTIGNGVQHVFNFVSSCVTAAMSTTLRGRFLSRQARKATRTFC